MSSNILSFSTYFFAKTIGKSHKLPLLPFASDRMASHMPGVPPQVLCMDFSHYLEEYLEEYHTIFPLSACMAHSLTSSKSLFKCHLLSKAFPDLSIQFAPMLLARMRPDLDSFFPVASSTDGTNRSLSIHYQYHYSN